MNENGFVSYQGRQVPKKGFRAFIYHRDGSKKLVNSWDEYLRHLDCNDWFSYQNEAKEFNEKIPNAINEEIPESKEPSKRGKQKLSMTK